MASLPSSSDSKRTSEDDETEVSDPKRPKIIRKPLKLKILTVIIKSFEGILEHITKLLSADDSKTTPVKEKQALLMDVTLAYSITNMICASHEIRQSKKNTEQLGTENSTTDFKITVSGSKIVVKQDHVLEIWDAAVKSVGLSYTDPKAEEKPWFGNINIFIHFFLSFSLRMRELKNGLNNFVLKETKENVDVLPIGTYGLTNAHHVLLEGVSFPPNKRLIMIEWLGPMTAFLCMLCSRNLHREKYVEVVRKKFAHITFIDEIINITRKPNPDYMEKWDIELISNLIAEILLRNPVSQETAMFFPLNFLVVAAAEHEKNGKLDWFLDNFSFTGSGGFYMYKTLVELQNTHKFTIRSRLREEMISQLVFHCMFGTFKEDFGVLSSITPNKNWLTRKEISPCFNASGSSCTDVQIELIPFKVYHAKTNPAKPPVLLVTPDWRYRRINSCVPCFSGRRISNYYVPALNNIEPKIIQIRNILEEILSKLKELKNNEGIVRISWRDWASLGLDTAGDEKPDFPVVRNGMTYVGKHNGIVVQE